MLMSVNDLVFLFEILSERQVPEFIAGAKAAKISQIDIGHNMAIKILEDLKIVDIYRLNNKMRKRFTILLEELEENTRLTQPGEKHHLLKELEEELHKQNFKSADEIQEFMNARNLSINSRPQKDLGGLTPIQLQDLFRRGWWESGGPIKLSSDIKQAEASAVPIVNNLSLMLRSIVNRSNRKGLKATSTGKLPRSVVNDVIPFLADTENHDNFHIKSGRKSFDEDDVYCLFIQRNIAESAGLLELRDNHWQVTAKGMGMIEPASASTLLVTVFSSMFHDFNLAFIDSYGAEPFMQGTIPYSLWQIANLPVGSEYTVSELAELVVHPEYLRQRANPAFQGAKMTFAHGVAASRLFRPLCWAGWLTPIFGKSIFDIERFRITAMPKQIFRTPDLPKPIRSEA